MLQIHRLLPAALLVLALPSCTGLPGGSEMLIIAGVVLLLFGGSKLPQLMRGMGSGINEFKKGLKEGEGEPDEKKDDPPKEIPSDGDGQ
jgi:sec-independent protein translocase protein TatA